jgi:uroporphyrinogen decarboxylase
MTSRERVLATCRFEEPDRVPIDLGGSTGASGIHVRAYDSLRRHLGLSSGTVTCDDIMQVLAVVEGDIQERFRLDVAAIGPTSVVREWEVHPLLDGIKVRLPAGLGLARQPDDTWVLTHPSGKRYLKPPASHYFDAEDGKGWYGLGPALTEETLATLQTYARTLYTETDLALTARFGGGFSSHQPEFLMDLLLEPAKIQDRLNRQCDALIDRYARLHQAIGDYTFCVVFADDLGTQNAPMLGPDLFTEAIAPHYRRFADWLHSHTNWQLYLHSCGAIEPLIETLIDCGVDILNPIQTSAVGMEPAELKRKYGGRIVFWGGGCDTQSMLGFRPPEEIAEHVRERVRIFAPGGGFVFNQVHVIQPNVPPEHICTMLDAAYEYGVYPL